MIGSRLVCWIRVEGNCSPYRICRGIRTTFFHFSFVHISVKNCRIINFRPDSESSLRFGIGIRFKIYDITIFDRNMDKRKVKKGGSYAPTNTVVLGRFDCIGGLPVDVTFSCKYGIVGGILRRKEKKRKKKKKN